MSDWPFPWPQPRSHYDDDGPVQIRGFKVNGVPFMVGPIGIMFGVSTGRARFCVTCIDCDELVHEATTSASQQILMHGREAHGWPR